MSFKDQITAWNSLPLTDKFSLSYLWYFVFGLPVIIYVLCFSPWANQFQADRAAFYKEANRRLNDPATREQELAKTVDTPDDYRDDH